MQKSSKISKQTFTILEEETFKNFSLEETQESLDKMFFEFMNLEEASDSERTGCTYGYFCIKKLLQSLKEKTDPSNISLVEVNVGFYA